MTSSISSLKRNEPSSSSSRVMASEIRHRLRAGGQEPHHHHFAAPGGALDGGGQPVMAAGGFDDDVGLHGGDGLRFVALEDLVRAYGSGDLQRLVVHVHGDDPRVRRPA